MSCGHGWHGCSPWCGPPYGRVRYEPVEWYEPSEWPILRRSRRPQRPDRGSAADVLEARLADLRDEMRRVEAELTELRGEYEAAREGA